LTVVCEPRDCAVVVDEKFQGLTKQNRATLTGFDPGETMVHVFAEGYEHLSRLIVLEEGKPAEAKFSLARTPIARQESARASLLRIVASLGGIDGLAELADIEAEGRMQWTNSSGLLEQWTVTFNKRVGNDLVATFKTPDGDCTASILAQAAKQECKGDLRNRGEKVAAQGTSLLLSYQLQAVIHALLKRPLITAEGDDNRLESFDAEDSYLLTIGRDGLPTDLVYRIRDSDSPIHLQYSNYISLGKGQYPGRISVGRLEAVPSWVFTLTSVRSRVAGRAKLFGSTRRVLVATLR
jgi:hypothetical protein